MSVVTIAEAWPAVGHPFTVAEPELTVFELRDGRYALAANASGPFAADRPFTVTIDPADLTRGLRR